MEIYQALEKIKEISDYFKSNLPKEQMHGNIAGPLFKWDSGYNISIKETEFSFSCGTYYNQYSFPLEQLEWTPENIFQGWQDSETARKNKMLEFRTRRVELEKTPEVQEYLKIQNK